MSEGAGVPTCYRHSGRETHIRCQRCDKPICTDCMRDAAVGFQCPDCVKQGTKETRSGRTTYGGVIPHKPGVVSLTLIGLNAAVWLIIQATGRYGSQLFQHFALIPSGACASITHPDGSYPTLTTPAACHLSPDGNWVAGVAHGAPWELVTSVFTHVEFVHIAFNMYALWVLGPELEHVLGRTRFLALYLLSGLAGSVSVLWLSDAASPVLGASGAVFGLMGGLLVIGHKARADLTGLWIWVGINGVLSFAVPHVSWQGHLGGLIGGAAIAAVLAYAPRERRSLVQWAGMAGVLVVLAVLAVARTAMLA